MATKLDTWPSLPTQTRYPWDKWLNGDILQLVQGEDYDAKTKTVVANARAQAKKRGGTVRTALREHGGRESIIVQFRRA